MTTLNTIIEEEEKEFDDHFSTWKYMAIGGAQTREVKDFLTKAMQRAYEAGREEGKE